MANFSNINKKVKKMFPTLDIVVVRGEGYVYFDGEDGFDKIDSIYCHPTSTSTETLLKLVVQNIESAYDFNERQ